MTSQSKQAQANSKQLENRVVDSLEQANAGLSEEVLSDIAQARISAINAARQQQSKAVSLNHWLIRSGDWLRHQVSLGNYKLAAPVAVAVVVAVLVSYNQNNPIPALPAELLSGDVPTEELAMLEELEFASWLAEQQQEGLL